MDYTEKEKKFYENKWNLVYPKWRKEKKPYLKKEAGIEGLTGLKIIKEYITKGNILDIGCGGGRNSVLFAKAGFNVFGVDFSMKAVELARINALEHGMKIDLKVGDALNLDYDNNFFDIVLDFGLFHHLRKSQQEKYIKNVSAVLKNEGYYLLYAFSTESDNTSRFQKKSEKNYAVFNGHYYHYYSIGEITKIFGEKFRILSSRIIKEEGRKLAFNIVLMQKK